MSQDTIEQGRGGWLAMVFAGAVAAVISGGFTSLGIAALSADGWYTRVQFPSQFDTSWITPAGGALLGVGIALGVIGVVLIVFGAHGWGKRTGLAQPAAPGKYPASITGRLDSPSRALWLVKWLLLVPHVIVFALLWVAFMVVSVIAWFAILFTARYPRSLFAFNVGVMRWGWRIGFYGYSALGTDAYPPFSLDPRPYPADLSVAYPERLSRGLVLVKSWLLAIPHLVIVALLSGAASGDRGASLLAALLVVAAIALLFTGRYLPGLFDFVLGIDRWSFRTLVYVSLMRDEYPPFRLDQGAEEPAAS